MSARCIECGRFLEPTVEKGSITCGYCNGRYDPDKIKACYDTSPCTNPSQDCNHCEWLSFPIEPIIDRPSPQERFVELLRFFLDNVYVSTP